LDGRRNMSDDVTVYRELSYEELGISEEEQQGMRNWWRDDRVTVYRSTWMTAGFYICAIIAVCCYLYLFVVHIL
jgi:hypothetical protein